MKKIINIFLVCVNITYCFDNKIIAQSESKNVESKIKISGYIQTQYQKFFVPDSVGSTTKYFSYFSGGSFTNDLTYSRFQIRRGHLTFSHTADLIKAKLSFDFTDKGFTVKDLYITTNKPVINLINLTAGIFNKPFGYETPTSSALRDSPERSRVVQTIFPSEKDLGIKIGFRLPNDNQLSFFELNTSIINGSGTAVEIDDYKDFIANIRLFTTNSDKNFKASGGFSFYNGKIEHIYEPVDTVASNVNTKFYIYYFGEIVDDINDVIYKGFYIDTAQTLSSGTTGIGVTRRYYSVDAQLGFNTSFGKIEICGEYIWGTQPSPVNVNNIEKDYVIYNEINTFSPSGPFLGVAWTLYDQPQPYNPAKVKHTNKNHNTMVRNFNGGYISLKQNIFDTKHQILIKYDWYDPNTKIAGKDVKLLYYKDTIEVGKTFMSPADVKFSTIGIGWICKITENLKLTLYYENVKNEFTSIPLYIGDLRLGRRHSPGFDKDIKDDVITIRLQYKF